MDSPHDKSLESEVITIDVLEAKNLLGSGFTYVDVRTVEEYNEGHVDAEKIFNLPYLLNKPGGRVKNPHFFKDVSSLFNENDKIVVGCQSGVRSLSASTDLVAAGFKNVRDMRGGFLEWVKQGLPVKPETLKEEEL